MNHRTEYFINERTRVVERKNYLSLRYRLLWGVLLCVTIAAVMAGAIFLDLLRHRP